LQARPSHSSRLLFRWGADASSDQLVSKRSALSAHQLETYQKKYLCETEHDLRRELSEYRDRYPKLGDDELFVLWFLRAFVTESEEDAASALSGGPRDKSVDAVLIDESARIVFYSAR
jgi:hypothetical protein